MFRKEITLALPLLLLLSCTSPSRESAEKSKAAPSGAGIHDSKTIIQVGDTLRLDVTVPGRKFGALETVQKDGNVATPDGSFIRADGISLGNFCVDLLNLYGNIPGYEQVQVSAHIESSPYKVVRYNPRREAGAASEEPKAKKSWDKDFWADFNERTKPQPKPVAAAPANPDAATLFPRNFNSPLSLWEAIRKEGGVPENVDPKKIHLLRRNLDRLSFDCSGPAGQPDGDNLVESGDVIFLVPAGTPLHGIFE